MNYWLIVEIGLLAVIVVFLVLTLCLKAFRLGSVELRFQTHIFSSENSGNQKLSVLLVFVFYLVGIQSWTVNHAFLQSVSFILVATLYLFELFWKKTIHTGGLSTFMRYWKWDQVIDYAWKEDILSFTIRYALNKDNSYVVSWHLKPGEREKAAPLLQRYLPEAVH